MEKKHNFAYRDASLPVDQRVRDLLGRMSLEEKVAADLTAFVPGRRLDDDANILLRFESGAKGVLHASQISVGEENGLNIRVYGEMGGLEWHQQEPNTLLLKWPDRPIEVLRTGMGYLGTSAVAGTRISAGHPEGYFEAFGNIYRNFAGHLRATLEGREPEALTLDYPKISDGIRGMAFIDAAVRSSAHNARWTALPV